LIWLVPIIFAVLAVSSLVLAYYFRDSRLQLLAAEALSLLGLALSLSRIQVDLSKYVLLFAVIAAALVFSYFVLDFLSGKLALVELVEFSTPVVVALFTIALWRSTQAQAEATMEMKRVQEQLASLETTPILALDSLILFEKVERGGFDFDSSGLSVRDVGKRSKIEVQFQVLNVGRYGVVVNAFSVYLMSNSSLKLEPMVFLPRPLSEARVIPPGGGAGFVVETKSFYKEIYDFFRNLEKCLPLHNRVSEAWGCLGVALKVVYGGSLEERWICFQSHVQPSAKVDGSEYKIVGFLSRCPNGFIKGISDREPLV